MKSKIRVQTILIHFAAWLMVYVLFCFVNSINTNYGILFWMDNIYYSFLTNVATAYFVVYFLIHGYLYKKKYLLFAILFLLTAVLSIILTRMVYYFVVLPVKWPAALEQTTFWGFSWLNGFTSLFLITGLLSFVELTRKWVREQREKSQLKTENLTNELKLLRSQLSPHFLFNTLNNIDSLIYQDHKKASAAVVKLSDLLRYMLYEAPEDKVDLKDEVEFLHSLLDLQRLRLVDENDIEFDVEGELDCCQIAPMLLVPFIENMFKHGSQKGDSPLFIISLKVAENRLELDCKNHIREVKNIDKRSGIGLENVKKRLDLLYGNNYDLMISNDRSIFEIHLKIDLDKLKTIG
nr:histidine kinase [Bacteroidota bacterium]